MALRNVISDPVISRRKHLPKAAYSWTASLPEAIPFTGSVQTFTGFPFINLMLCPEERFSLRVSLHCSRLKVLIGLAMRGLSRLVTLFDRDSLPIRLPSGICCILFGKYPFDRCAYNIPYIRTASLYPFSRANFFPSQHLSRFLSSPLSIIRFLFLSWETKFQTLVYPEEQEMEAYASPTESGLPLPSSESDSREGLVLLMQRWIWRFTVEWPLFM